MIGYRALVKTNTALLFSSHTISYESQVLRFGVYKDGGESGVRQLQTSHSVSAVPGS